ncbi:hypothetical protein N7462_009179 [Penicillium macrosclerotiorum]|uniref:uncharacterized protein n=1 Tax=Penicillium macrosclerotiorum TaxID=303699 RepID=UPI0025466A9C|nr:uncharacterized protein N7462_009179 [Penicillium macrosclerotiorum]KAJ5673740.1 hypothetical protein N7462_009179 [Penicillium macrosclerotiorum]
MATGPMKKSNRRGGDGLAYQQPAVSLLASAARVALAGRTADKQRTRTIVWLMLSCKKLGSRARHRDDSGDTGDTDKTGNEPLRIVARASTCILITQIAPCGWLVCADQRPFILH